jgi:hypothetical protein
MFRSTIALSARPSSPPRPRTSLAFPDPAGSATSASKSSDALRPHASFTHPFCPRFHPPLRTFPTPSTPQHITLNWTQRNRSKLFSIKHLRTVSVTHGGVPCVLSFSFSRHRQTNPNSSFFFRSLATPCSSHVTPFASSDARNSFPFRRLVHGSLDALSGLSPSFGRVKNQTTASKCYAHGSARPRTFHGREEMSCQNAWKVK